MGNEQQVDGRSKDPYRTARAMLDRVVTTEEVSRLLGQSTARLVGQAKEMPNPRPLPPMFERKLRDAWHSVRRTIESLASFMCHAEHLIAYRGSDNFRKAEPPPVVLGPGGDFTKSWPHVAEKAIAGRHAERVAREPERDFQNVTAEQDDARRRREAAVLRENLSRELGVLLDIKA
jgi:hypothetical protein